MFVNMLQDIIETKSITETERKHWKVVSRAAGIIVDLLEDHQDHSPILDSSFDKIRAEKGLEHIPDRIYRLWWDISCLIGWSDGSAAVEEIFEGWLNDDCLNWADPE